MAQKKILFFSGSIGLGHVRRDLAIARELRRLGDAQIEWLAASPADQVIREAGEFVLPESIGLADESAVAEGRVRGGRLNLVSYIAAARHRWSQNVEIVDRLVARHCFDLLIGDETYEIAMAYRRDPSRQRCPFVMIYDFVGAEATSRNPLERLGVYLLNRMWSRQVKSPAARRMNLFIGEEEDISEARFGFLLPRRRDWARVHCRVVGYVLPFDPLDYTDRGALRTRLGYDASPLVVCSIGGTAIGRELLELCGRAYPIASEPIKNLRMILVCGPRLVLRELDVPPGVEVRGYVPAFHEHLAASDLAIVQGGGSITLELTALGRPFLYFPIEGHFEQEIAVAGRLRRHGAGVGLRASTTTPARLAEAIVENIGKPVSYAKIRTDGARRAAAHVAGLLGWSTESPMS